MTDNKKTKICSRKDCQFVGLEQNIGNFGFKNKKKGRYRPECKSCRNADEKKAFQKDAIIKTDDIKTKTCSKKDCKFAGQEQDIGNFGFRNKKRKIFHAECKSCISIKNVQWRQDHKEEIAVNNKEWRQNNKEDIAIYQTEYYQDHKEEIIIAAAQYRKDHKEELNKKDCERKKKRRHNDPIFKLREYVSNSIYCALVANGSSKKGKSILKYLHYTIQELHTYIENLFSHSKNMINDKVWMSWDNQGRYIKAEWDDNDPSTWKWQLDHIIPQSILPFTSMEDDNFKKCWELNNLRPLKAKDNVMDGANRTRHKKD